MSKFYFFPSMLRLFRHQADQRDKGSKGKKPPKQAQPVLNQPNFN